MAAFTLSCLSIAGVSSARIWQQAETEPHDPASHRGSGRVVTQVPQGFEYATPYSYRGTGRVFQGPETLLGHRGSGRVTQGLPAPTTSYRGSGRIV